MGQSARIAGRACSWRVLLAVLCVLLVAVCGTVHAAHMHPDSDDSHANCSLCATAHVTVHLVQTPAPAPVAAVVAVVELLPPAELACGFRAFSYFTRPPPAAALPA